MRKGGVAVKRMLWLPLALALLLAGCGLGETELYGEVMQARVEGGRLSGFVLRTEEGKDVTVSLSENTQILSWIDQVDEDAFLAGDAENIQVTVTALRDGAGYIAGEIEISGARRPEGLILSDGTAVEIWDTAFFRYQLYPARRHGAPAGEQAQRAAERACGRCGGL